MILTYPPLNPILNQTNLVQQWMLSWTKWMQSTTGAYPEPYDCSPTLDTTLNHRTAVYHWILPEAYNFSPQTGSSSECSPHWILSWTKWMQSTTGSSLNHMTPVHHWILPSIKWVQSTSGSYPEPNERSPLLDPILNQMNAVNHWILSWILWMQSTTASYPEPYECSPPLQPILNHMNAVHHWILSWTVWL